MAKHAQRPGADAGTVDDAGEFACPGSASTCPALRTNVTIKCEWTLFKMASTDDHSKGGIAYNTNKPIIETVNH